MATQIVIQVPSSAVVAGKTGKEAQAEVDAIVHEILASPDSRETRGRLVGLQDPELSVEESSRTERGVLNANFTPGSGVKGLTDKEIEAEIEKWAAYGTDSRKISGVSAIAIDSIGSEAVVQAAGCYCRWRRAC
jgi:hypothetical protein